MSFRVKTNADVARNGSELQLLLPRDALDLLNYPLILLRPIADCQPMNVSVQVLLTEFFDRGGRTQHREADPVAASPKGDVAHR